MASQPIPVRVLVIDDDPMSRDLLRLLLQAEGYLVECVDSGGAALASLRQSDHPPGLVLADAQMPGIAGGRLAGELRRACPPQTPLLAMSGSRPPEDAISRFDGFLLKPFTMEQVASALATGGSAHKTAPDAAREIPRGTAKSSTRRNRRGVAVDPARRSPSTVDSISIQASALPTGGVPVPEVQRLDPGIYSKLADLMTAQQLREIYSLCVADVRKRIAAMRRMAVERDGTGLAREAHAIKGSCGMLGATEMARLAAQMETSGLQAAFAEGSQQVNSLDELSAACDRLERILGSRT